MLCFVPVETLGEPQQQCLRALIERGVLGGGKPFGSDSGLCEGIGQREVSARQRRAVGRGGGGQRHSGISALPGLPCY